MKKRVLGLALICFFIVLTTCTNASAQSPIAIDTSNPTTWVISNGALTVKWMPGNGRIFSIRWSAFPDQELIDQTNRDRNGPKGFYMDNVASLGGPTTPSYFLDPNGQYIDFWIAGPASSTGGFAWSWHDVLFANDPGVHVYFVLDHGPGDAAASVGQIQWVFRGDLNQFTNTYDVNTGLGNLGARTVPTNLAFGDGGRGVQDATNDLHGLSEPVGFRRSFYTKYDYSSSEYLHRGEGVYGSNIAAWMVVPNSESLTGGPTKQDLIFTNNLLIMEAYSNHLDNNISFQVPQDAVLHRIYGPFYLHFNSLSATTPTAASLYAESQAASKNLLPLYNKESELLANGYVSSTQRGEVDLNIQGAQGLAPLTGWAVLSDPNTNFQYSHAGTEYWSDINPGGLVNFHGVVPGTYRLSVYVLGQWGEMRLDDVQVKEHSPTHLSVNFAPEAFSSSLPLWTIGTADRSSHEFLHGTITNPVDLDPNYTDEYVDRFGDSVQDDREFWGNWNYWSDFAANSGAVVYYATQVGSTAATNDPAQWNYNQWHVFHPGLYAGIYNPSDQTTDGYNYICPSYVGPFGACSTAAVPDWQVHFATPGQQGSYVVLSVGLAATEANLTVSLNGMPLKWTGTHFADADARSGFSGTYQWVVFQWPTSLLNAAGADNVLTFHVDKTQGVMYDALRMEITGDSTAHESTGWNDYEFVSSDAYEPANDAIDNQN
ncbi:MAG TPA: polysaccharide lyase family protein [Candidatus Acidoferrales bacterium]|nr:polysaccharide lyase family protein [Candidatus Acidoferrales bacterium]